MWLYDLLGFQRILQTPQTLFHSRPKKIIMDVHTLLGIFKSLDLRRQTWALQALMTGQPSF